MPGPTSSKYIGARDGSIPSWIDDCAPGAAAPKILCAGCDVETTMFKPICDECLAVVQDLKLEGDLS